MENVVKVNNRFDEIIDKATLGLPMTPSNWVGEPKYKNIMIIGMSYGGGMGGSYRKLYCTRINNIYDYLSEKQFIEVDLIDGTTEIINRDFIVSIDCNYQLMTAYLDNNNSNFTKGINEYHYLVPNGHMVNLINKY